MKQIKTLFALGVAAITLTTTTVARAGYMQPGETMGASLISPLPEGVFFSDQESYGRSPNLAPGNHVGVGINIPVLIWSTPITFYNTRLEILASIPFAHVDGAGQDRIGFASQALGPLFAHDFGSGLSGGVGILFRPPNASANLQDTNGETRSEADLRESLEYDVPGNGPFGGVTLKQNAAFTSCLCRHYGPVTITADGLPIAVQNDLFAGDFTAEKAFGKFKIGFTGYGNIDTNNIAGLTNAATNFNPHEKNVALGGLVEYNFGRFVMTGIVTRTLFRNAIVPSISAGPETRGLLRIAVPLYIAPPPSVPVVARY